MTTFSQIHDNASGYRNDYLELNNLCLQVSNEKKKGDPVVSWFRLRNRRIVQVLEPMKEELESRIKKETEEVENFYKGLEDVKKARNAIQNNKLLNAQRIISEQTDIKLSQNTDEAMSELSNLERQIKKDRTILINNISYYKKSSQNVDRVKDIFSSVRRAKDIDYQIFSSAIASINHQKKTLDINVPDLKELPQTYDKAIIDDLHAKIRAVISRIDSRYPMKIFAPAIRVNRVIIHDVGNDRGSRAFNNRSEEILRNVNEAIDIFNNKYWQITGQRWERISTNTHGYRSVASTHSKVKSI